MIRSICTNNQLLKIGKYIKFLMLRTYNLLVITVIFLFIIFNAMNMVTITPILGLIYLLALSFVIYILIVVGGFAIITFLLQMALVDIADLPKIYKFAQKLDVEIEDYRIFDNSVFESLTKEQIFYGYCGREEIAAYIALNKELTKKQLTVKIDREEYMLIAMITRQMERLGK